MLHKAALFLLACAFPGVAQGAPVDELYPQLYGFNPNGNPTGYTGSDPLAKYTWDPSQVNVTAMQRYEAYATAVLATPSTSVSNPTSLLNGGGNATFLQFGRLRLDLGVEHAGWFEFFSPDLAAVLSTCKCVVKASISEYNEPWPGKTQAVKAYDNNLFRLETNSEYYEGVRFAWVLYEPSSPQETGAALPWTLTGVRVVAQVKPVNYTSNFASSDPTLTAVWHAGALGSRLNMHEQYFGSILMDRGDRVSIQGDGHPTMAAALAAFASPEVHRLVKVMLNATNSGCPGCHVVDEGIMSYPVLWTMSVHDWLWSSGDGGAFLGEFADSIARILEGDAKSFLTNPFLSLQGWDDRLGNGWCFPPATAPCGREPQLTFAAQLAMATQEFAAALGAAGDAARAANATAAANALVAALAAAVPLDSDAGTLGVHSASMFLNVQGLVTTPSQTATLVSRYLNDSASICSWSPFNSYWILQGLGNAGELDRASEMAALCWGGMTRMAPGCFWELFEPAWEGLVEVGGKAPTRPSYCHPWSNGVTAWMSRALGGINPVAPGYAGLGGYVVTPHVSARYPFISTATTHGGGGSGGSGGGGAAPISVNATFSQRVTSAANSDGGGLPVHFIRTVTVEAPSTPGVVGVPMTEAGSYDSTPCQLLRLRVNGAATAPITLQADQLGGALRFRATLPHSHVFSPKLPPGSHTVTAEYTCSGASTTTTTTTMPPSPVFPPITWRALAWDVDYSTHGDWVGKRGGDGYHLFAFDTNATGFPLDVSNLPPYALSVTPHLSGFENVDYRSLGVNNSDTAFLQDPRGGVGPPESWGTQARGGMAHRALPSWSTSPVAVTAPPPRGGSPSTSPPPTSPPPLWTPIKTGPPPWSCG